MSNVLLTHNPFLYHLTNQRPDEVWSFQTQRSQVSCKNKFPVIDLFDNFPLHLMLSKSSYTSNAKLKIDFTCKVPPFDVLHHMSETKVSDIFHRVKKNQEI